MRGLLHHVAQLAGQGQPGRAGLGVGERGLDVEDVAARARHGQAGGHARDGRPALLGLLGRLGGVVRPADQRPQVVRADRDGQLALAQFALRGDLPQDAGDRALQIPDARLAGILAREPAQRVLVHRDLVGLQSRALQLPGQQVVAGDDDLLVLGVAVEPDQLHPVEQRLRDGLQHIGRRQEHHVGEVELDLQVVVAEGVVLRRVQHLQQGRRRVAPVVGADLVDLVEQHHRVHRTGFLDGAHDPAGECADVRAPVATDLRLVTHAAERHPDELAPHRARHGLTERGLADPGRPDQRQHCSPATAADQPEPLVLAPLADGQVLDDPVLHVRQPRVVGVQHRPRARDVVRVLGALVPRQLQDGVQPGTDPGALGRLVGGALQLVDLLEGRLADLLGQVCRLDPGAVVALLVGRVAVQLGQLLADGLQLLAQQELLLLLGDALLDVLADGVVDLLLREVVAHQPERVLQAGHLVGLQQHLELLLGGGEGRVPDVVGQLADALDLRDPVDDLPGAALAQPLRGERLVLLDQLGGPPCHRQTGVGLAEGAGLDPERGTRAGGAGTDPDPADGPDQRCRVAVGEAADLLDGGQCADGGVRAVQPWHQQDLGLGPARDGRPGRFDGGTYLGVGQIQRDHHARQHDLVVERQHGQSERCGRRCHDLSPVSEVELT